MGHHVFPFLVTFQKQTVSFAAGIPSPPKKNKCAHDVQGQYGEISGSAHSLCLTSAQQVHLWDVDFTMATLWFQLTSSLVGPTVQAAMCWDLADQHPNSSFPNMLSEKQENIRVINAWQSQESWQECSHHPSPHKPRETSVTVTKGDSAHPSFGWSQYLTPLTKLLSCLHYFILPSFPPLILLCRCSSTEETLA